MVREGGPSDSTMAEGNAYWLMHTISQRFVRDGVEYLVDPPVEFPLSSSDAALRSPLLRVLESLWFEERIWRTHDGWQVGSEELYRLDPSEAAALELPT